MIWRIRGSRISLPASLAILLPVLAAQQQLPIAHPNDAAASSLQNRHNAQSNEPHIAFNSVNTPVKPIDEKSALATLALAASGSAVRAPSIQISSRSNAAPLLQARSLEDWEVEDFVLLATVDGTIHARDRKTGAHRWALVAPSSPMVETTYYKQNRSDTTEGDFKDDDFLWIVEPSRDGNIYIYDKNHNGGLQKLGLTVKMLADETPYSGFEPPVTYTARKETTLYTINSRTGSILKVFSSRGPTNNDETCRRVSDFDATDSEECETFGTLTLGRVEYTVSIQNTETGTPICTIKFAEWSPNNRDSDLQNQYFKAMDNRYIFSMHDGVIFGFDHSKPDGRRYTQKLSSPVARVFDVARPLSSESPNTQLVVLTQPPSESNYESAGIENRESRVFINCTDSGSWYAMSESTYPLVTGRVGRAECYDEDFLTQEQRLATLNFAQQKAALVGVHLLSDMPHRGAQPNIPQIASPASEPSNNTPRDNLKNGERLPPSISKHNSVIFRKGRDNALDIFVSVILVLVGVFFYYNTHNIQEIMKQKLDLKKFLPIPDSSMHPSVPKITTEAAKERITGSVSNPQLGPQPDASVGDSQLLEKDTLGANGRIAMAGTENLITISPSRDLASEIDPSDSEAALKLTPRKKARRGRRGGQQHKRGKKNKQGSQDASNNPVSSGENDSDKTSGPLLPTNPELRLTRTRSNTEIIEPDGAVRIGQLKVYTDAVLGHGSHGTIVYKGSFDGRDVAVKRLLVEFYDIASREVELLQESDDHGNVIRYYCREQTSGFLYIALELCPASLQDIIERPQNYSDSLNAELELPDILRQITQGVRYLHSLKIVHRDLKPQNILVATRKKSPQNSNNLRLLISDFGLCKKLDDNQSSFRATTAHAAGTSGWRAPELLVDDDNQNGTGEGSSSNQWATTSSLESSEPAVVDPQTNRRATRAIDIFSLGCVFYYVLTRGGHPFDKDGKFMREANIVKGQHDLSELDRLGNYAFEAEDLISRMLSTDPRLRPDATSVLIHPFFWSPAERLSFLCDVSDHFEFECRDPPSAALQCLEYVGPNVMYPDMDFLKALPKEFKDSLGKQRRYTGSRMLDLLRALRNKRNHYNDMPEQLKTHIGGLPDGYLNFWTIRFPSLLINCHWVILKLGLTDTEVFKRYFTP